MAVSISNIHPATFLRGAVRKEWRETLLDWLTRALGEDDAAKIMGGVDRMPIPAALYRRGGTIYGHDSEGRKYMILLAPKGQMRQLKVQKKKHPLILFNTATFNISESYRDKARQLMMARLTKNYGFPPTQCDRLTVIIPHALYRISTFDLCRTGHDMYYMRTSTHPPAFLSGRTLKELLGQLAEYGVNADQVVDDVNRGDMSSLHAAAAVAALVRP